MIRELTRHIELGQVWTPPEIALRMAKDAIALHPKAKFVLDPACGPATFSTALYKAGSRNINLACYEIDKRLHSITKTVNQELGFKAETKLADYMGDASLKDKYDIIIMNPPYIRQEALKQIDKNNYHKFLTRYLKVGIDKRANLFALFLLKGLIDLAPRGILCAIVYDAISQSGYGKQVLELITDYAKLVKTEHIKTPFQDVLVDAQILIFRKRNKPSEHKKVIERKDGDGLVSMERLLSIRRGTGFPLRKIFFARPNDPYFDKSKPFFVKQGKLSGFIIKPDERAYLATDLDYEIIKWLQTRAKDNEILNLKTSVAGITGPIVFNYYIRNAPRHLWNPDNIAVADNFYVSSPRTDFPSEVAWLLLNSEVYLSRILKAARNQGNGLLKLQLYEYKNVLVPDWHGIPKTKVGILSKTAKALIKNRILSYPDLRECVDQATRGLFNE